MRRAVALLLALALALSLTACGGKIREIENYSVAQQADESWAIVYTDEEGVELIAPLGAAPQPLVLEKGRFYFAEAGKLVSVDPEGEGRQETVIADMAADATIRFTDEENFYLLGTEENPVMCWRVSKTDSADSGLVTIPRKFRPTDYEELLAEVKAMVSAVEGEIRLKSATASLDENGSLLGLHLEILRYDGITNDMNFWDRGAVEVRVGLEGVVADYQDYNTPLFLANETAQEELALTEYLGALEALDTAELATKTAQGHPANYTVTYLGEAAAEDAPCYSLQGAAVDAIEGRRLALIGRAEDGAATHSLWVAMEG